MQCNVQCNGALNSNKTQNDPHLLDSLSIQYRILVESERVRYLRTLLTYQKSNE